MALPGLAIVTVILHIALAVVHQRLANGVSVGTDTIFYYAVIAGVLACYAAVIRSAHEARFTQTWRVLVGVPIVVQLGWLIALPMLSIDAYSYLVDAAHAHAGLNPYVHAAKDVAGTELGHTLEAYGWRPVHGVPPYGPVWLSIVAAIGPYASDVEVGVRLLKLLAFGATALTAWLVYLTAPDSFRVRAFTAFWWNPVVIVEGAGEGHNDALMTVAVVLSLWCLRRTAIVSGAAALTAAVLTKWIPTFFGPAYLMYAWRNGLLNRRRVALGAAVTIAIIVGSYWPFWAGAETFDGIRNLGRPRFVASTTGSFVRFFGQYPTAVTMLRALALGAVVATTIYAAAATRTLDDLYRACAASALAYILVGSPTYWAWYVLLPIALLTLVGDIPLILALTVGSRLVAPLDLVRLRGGMSWTTEVWGTTVIAIWLPLAFIAVRALSPRHAPAT
jgi:alpha-1,6-mannosyltransferase